jgi:lysozyme
MLLQDVKDWGVHVLSLLEGKAFSDNEVAALISFSYNVGIGAFASSTMRQDLLVGSILLAASQFLLWNHSGGKVVRGLTVRRKIEQAVFLGATFTPALCTLIEDSVPQ